MRVIASLFFLLLVEAVSAHAQARTSPLAAPLGPCDIYAAAGTPCVAAHSTTRTLYARYRGPLYQVKRWSDGKTVDISAIGREGYANAAIQDKFCLSTPCVINVIYDQSGKENHLYQAAPGTFKGPAKGAFNTLSIADMAPVTVAGHKVYGVYIMPGMGYRNNDAAYLPIGDEPQGIYSVVDGTHYDSGCCFDYGNASTNGRAVGTGTMDTTYFGTSTVWGRGAGAGPWLMTDMEAGLFSGHSAKQNVADPSVTNWRFATEVVDGGGGNHWDLRGGDAQTGKLTTFYSGVRPDANSSGGYFPMRRQGAVLLGTGGDNGNGSSGTFYEGVVTAGHPGEATTDAVQANIVAARYKVAQISVARVRAFPVGSSQDVALTFTNSEDIPVSNVQFRLSLPTTQWRAVAEDNSKRQVRPQDKLAPGASVTARFKVTAPASTGSGFLTATAEWSSNSPGHAKVRESTVERVRSVPAVKLNEARFSTTSNTTDQFIELYNASDTPVDLSRWSLIHTPSQWAATTLATIPPGKILAPHAFYVLGVATSALLAPAARESTVLLVRSVSGLAAGQQIHIDSEMRTIASVGTAAEAMTTVFIPVSTGPWTTIPAGATNIPVTNAAGFAAGQKIGIDAGGHYEIATVTAVGKAATQTVLSAAAAAGASRMQVEAGANILPGDTLILGTGQRKEIAKVATVGSATNHTEVTLVGTLKLDHAAGIDVSDRGTGVTFTPATKFSHTSGDALQALGSGVTLDRPLQYEHGYGAPVVAQATGVGYQGSSAPDQWFGTPLSTSAGSIALMDASGTTVVDALVYGSQQSNSSGNGTITSPELATLVADQGGGGCIVVVPVSLAAPGTSVSRDPDGADTDSNCKDFRTQAAASIAVDAPIGATSVKLSSVTGFSAGQTILIGGGSLQETATIASVGTAGGTLLRADVAAGATVLPVAGTTGFAPGQIITLGSDADAESATIASMARRPPATITTAAPLTHAHGSGSALSGSGITLTHGVSMPHQRGENAATGVPSPGRSNP